jgi:hypothetical protein
MRSAFIQGSWASKSQEMKKNIFDGLIVMVSDIFLNKSHLENHGIKPSFVV